MKPNVVPQPRTGQESVEVVRRIVVGVDGSPASVRALGWALELADLYGGDVEAVTAWPLDAPVVTGEAPGPLNDARRQALQAQRLALAHVRELIPEESVVSLRLENALPADALLTSATGAALVVLGTRPEDAAARPSAVSLAEGLQLAAPCPVLEISALGVCTVPFGQHAFTTPAVEEAAGRDRARPDRPAPRRSRSSVPAEQEARVALRR